MPSQWQLVPLLAVVVIIAVSGCISFPEDEPIEIIPVCGDTYCQIAETDPNSEYYCVEDCPQCGDSVCDIAEADPSSMVYCPKDCPSDSGS